MTSTSHPAHRQHRGTAATYVQFGSFQNPQDHMMHKHSIQDPQSPDMIREEVTSSFDVKPLYPRPCFPKQAQVLPLACQGDNTNHMVQGHDRDLAHKGHFLPLGQRPYQGKFFLPQQGSTVRAATMKGSLNSIECTHPGDENFVYIHRHNSFIDVSRMTHHDHSSPVHSGRPGKVQNIAEMDSLTNRCRSHSNDEFDAAMTLATCLKTEN